ncbi:MAG TPA: TonB-dependent receptor [Terriglobales bacterium]|nr:TonB-dependent receptor [Terriglobales bacterium]
MKLTGVVICTLFTAAFLCSTVFAATQNATVYGTVYDAAGNPAPGVSVILDNPALGISRTAVTGTDGTYNFAEVPPADAYRIRAVKSGKEIDVRTNISINVGDERVILPPLSEKAEVAAGAAPAGRPKVVESARAVTNETVSTSVSGVITGDQLRSLPLYNRNFLVLGLLTPNVHEPEANSPLRGGSFSIAGSRPSSNNFLLDGADNVASSSNQAIPFQLNDSVQEFRVTSSTASAEYGRNLGGVVNVVTRRAGNNFHGSVFGYFGNDALNASSPLSVYNGTTFDKAASYAGPTNAAPVAGGFGLMAPTTYNQYVATAESFGYCTNSIGVATSAFCASGLGGFGGNGANDRFDPALLLSKHNQFKAPFDSKQFGGNAGMAIVKDKLFVFGSYEGTRIDNSNPILERVPSSFDRQYDPLGARGASFFPLNFASNDPNFVMAQNVLSLYPAANITSAADGAVPDALEFYQGEAPNYTHVHNFVGRMDWVQSSSSSWTFRYVLQKLNQLHDDSLPEQSNYPGNGAFRDASNHSATVSFSHNFSPRLVNEARVSFTQFRIDETAQDASFDATTIGLPTRQMMTFLLSGLDTQYSGAVNAFFCGFCISNGAFAGWGEFWPTAIFFPFSSSPMLPTLDGLFPMARMGAPLNAPSQRRDQTWMAADNLSWSHGKHSLRFGGEYRRLGNRFMNAAFSRGYAVSGNIGEFTSDSETCNESCSGFFGGFIPQAFVGPSFDYALRQQDPYAVVLTSQAFAGFVQDTIRLHPRFTINLGLRYEYFSPPEADGQNLWNFDPAANGLVQQGHTDVVNPFGDACAPFVPYSATYPANFSFFTNGFNPWTCNSTGNPEYIRTDKNNVAPRAGFAWDVFGNGKTVIRGGIGLYYDQLPVSYVSQLMFNRPTPLNQSNPQAMYGQNFGFPFFVGGFNACDPFAFSFIAQCGLGNTMLNPATIDAVTPLCTLRFNCNTSQFVSASSPFAIYAMDPAHSETPMSRQMNLTWQQSLSGKLAFELGYVGTSARHLPVVYNQGFANEFFCTFSAPDCDTIHNFPAYTMTNRGGSAYHSMMVRLRASDWHGLKLNAAYSWSKGIDNASGATFPLIPATMINQTLGFQISGTGDPRGFCNIFGSFFFACPAGVPAGGAAVIESPALTTTGAGQVITSPYLIAQDPMGTNFLINDKGKSDFNSTNRLVLDYVWNIPSFRKSKWLDYWQVSGIFTAQSGQPFTIFAGPASGEIDQRVNVNGQVITSYTTPTAILPNNLELASVACLTNPNANPFAVPASGDTLYSGTPGTACIGNSQRNAYKGPSFVNMNLAVQKGFPIGNESRMLTIRAEFFNLTNQNNYYNPISALSLDAQSINPDFGKIKSAHDPRQIQFAARFTW